MTSIMELVLTSNSSSLSMMSRSISSKAPSRSSIPSGLYFMTPCSSLAWKGRSKVASSACRYALHVACAVKGQDSTALLLSRGLASDDFAQLICCATQGLMLCIRTCEAWTLAMTAAQVSAFVIRYLQNMCFCIWLSQRSTSMHEHLCIVIPDSQ